MFAQDTFGKKVEKGKFTGSEATTKFPRASCFKKPMRSVPELRGHMYNVLARSARLHVTVCVTVTIGSKITE
jgi:hypothetical protein